MTDKHHHLTRLPLVRREAEPVEESGPRPRDATPTPRHGRTEPAPPAPDPGTISAEFTKLVGAIQWSAALLQDQRLSEPERRNLAAEILHAADRLDALWRQGGGAAPPRTPLTPPRSQPDVRVQDAFPEPRPLDVNETVTRSLRALGSVLADNLSIQPRLCADRLPVRCAETHLRQVIFRLAVAAQESLVPGGTCQLETQRVEISERQAAWIGGAQAGTYASLRFVYPANDRPPAAPTSGRGPDGRPATTRFIRGLADAQRLVTEAGGFLQVAVTPGAPSWFTVLLPIATLPENATRRALRESWPPTPGATVLVVDGDPDERSRQVLLLRAAGYRVLEAESAEEAAVVVADAGPPPALLVTDLVLPGLPGAALAEQLGRRFPRLQVIYTSTVARQVIIASGDLSADAPFVAKPCTEDTLLTTARRLLDLPTG